MKTFVILPLQRAPSTTRWGEVDSALHNHGKRVQPPWYPETFDPLNACDEIPRTGDFRRWSENTAASV